LTIKVFFCYIADVEVERDVFAKLTKLKKEMVISLMSTPELRTFSPAARYLLL